MFRTSRVELSRVGQWGQAFELAEYRLGQVVLEIRTSFTIRKIFYSLLYSAFYVKHRTLYLHLHHPIKIF